MRVSWTATEHGYVRTVTPPARRTIWTVTHIMPSFERVAVVDGTLTRTAAIRRATGGVAILPGDTIIATHSVVR